MQLRTQVWNQVVSELREWSRELIQTARIQGTVPNAALPDRVLGQVWDQLGREVEHVLYR